MTAMGGVFQGSPQRVRDVRLEDDLCFHFHVGYVDCVLFRVLYNIHRYLGYDYKEGE